MTQIPDGYEARECYICHGTSIHHDPTSADNVHLAEANRSGRCFKCDGQGYTLHITTAGMWAEMAAYAAR